MTHIVLSSSPVNLTTSVTALLTGDQILLLIGMKLLLLRADDLLLLLILLLHQLLLLLLVIVSFRHLLVFERDAGD